MEKILSTGNIAKAYDVVDVVFVIDSDKAGLFSGAKPERAFDGVKAHLRDKCADLGGDAVINCQFEYRVALAGKKQVIEFFAYGTVIKFQ